MIQATPSAHRPARAPKARAPKAPRTAKTTRSATLAARPQPINRPGLIGSAGPRRAAGGRVDAAARRACGRAARVEVGAGARDAPWSRAASVPRDLPGSRDAPAPRDVPASRGTEPPEVAVRGRRSSTVRPMAAVCPVVPASCNRPHDACHILLPPNGFAPDGAAVGCLSSVCQVSLSAAAPRLRPRSQLPPQLADGGELDAGRRRRDLLDDPVKGVLIAEMVDDLLPFRGKDRPA